MKTLNTAWEDLCSAADASRINTTVHTPSLTTVHPFAKLGPKPYYFESLDHAPEGVRRSCGLCGKGIKNLYTIRDGQGMLHTLGSECVLGMANGFETHLIGQVKFAKKRFEKKQRENREAKFVAKALEQSLQIFPEECRFLQDYKGNFEFYVSLRNQLHYKGSLSEKQWASLTRAVEKQNAPKPAAPARVFSLAVGTTLIVTKFFAKIIGRDTGLNRPHFAIEVLNVEAETEKAYKIEAKLTAQRTSHCCVCGLTLTNPVSVQAGIGPICGQRYEVSTVEELHAKLATQYTAKVSLWIPKSQIKERK